MPPFRFRPNHGARWAWLGSLCGDFFTATSSHNAGEQACRRRPASRPTGQNHPVRWPGPIIARNARLVTGRPQAACRIDSGRGGRCIDGTSSAFPRPNSIFPDQPPPLLQAYLDNRPGLARLLRARLGSDEEAEDVLQELYLHLRRPIDAQRVENSAAYLYRMALNLARDHRRGRDRARRRDGDWADVSQTTLGPNAIVDLPDAEAVYEGRQRLARLAAAVAGLPPQCRRVFTLHKLQGFSHAEIAAKLNISRSAVEKHMNVALKHLARHEAADRKSTPER